MATDQLAELQDWDQAWEIALTTIMAVLTWELATPEGSYNYARREEAVAPWIEIYGRPRAMPS